MSDAPIATPLDYERRPRPRRSAGERVRDAIAATFAISLAILWPVWAVVVTHHLTGSAARNASLPASDCWLIAGTFAAPIGFAIVVCVGTSSGRRRSQRR